MNNAQSVKKIAKMLAREHESDDPYILEIYWAPHSTEVRLVEISSAITKKGEILPFRFTADPPDVPYESVVVLLSPADWEGRTDLEWPDGFENLERVFERDNCVELGRGVPSASTSRP